MCDGNALGREHDDGRRKGGPHEERVARDLVGSTMEQRNVVGVASFQRDRHAGNAGRELRSRHRREQSVTIHACMMTNRGDAPLARSVGRWTGSRRWPGRARQFEQRLGAVHADQWTLPTPCAEWDVRGLVNHLVTADTTTVRLLTGATREETVAMIGADHLGDDPVGAYAHSADAQAAALSAPGALEMTVPHPTFDMSASQLLDFRIGDTLLHAWDLARAISVNEDLDPVVVEFVWQSLQPLAEILPTTGAFGDGRSGALAEDAPLQQRLLDLSGRRP